MSKKFLVRYLTSDGKTELTVAMREETKVSNKYCYRRIRAIGDDMWATFILPDMHVNVPEDVVYQIRMYCGQQSG